MPRRPWALALPLTFALLLAACGGGDKEPAPTAPATTQEQAPTAPAEQSADDQYTLTADADGSARLTIPASDPLIPGVEINVSAGAVDPGTTLTIAAGPNPGPSLSAIATTDPDLFRALTDYALDRADSLIAHPLYTPFLVIANAQPAGPTLQLEPSGATFPAPIEIRIPLALLDIDPDSAPLVLLQSTDGTWDVAADAVIDDASGVLTVAVSHFSGLSVWRVIRNVFGNVSGTVDAARLTDAQETLAIGPAAAIQTSLLATVRCRDAQLTNGQLSAGVDHIPESLTDLLNYLGRDVGEVADISDTLIDDLEQWIDQQAAARRPRGARGAQHSVTLPEIFQRSLELTNFDVFRALALSHGVLRDNRPQPDQIGSPFFDSIQLVRGDGGDEAGATYHFFGMAVYAFAYEYQRDTGRLSFANPSAETAARLEEAWVSGDIVSDTVEYAVDLQGAQFGRLLYQHFLADATGQPSPISDEVCEGGLNLLGEFDFSADPSLAQFASLFTANAIAFNLTPTPDHPIFSHTLTGDFTLTYELPGSVLYALFAGFGEAIGEAVGGAVTAPFAPGEEPPVEEEEPEIPPEFADCFLILHTDGELEGGVAAANGQVLGSAALTATLDQRGCEDTDLDLGALPPPQTITADWEGTYDGTSLTGAIAILSLDSDAAPIPLPFTASPQP